jgi:type II secretory pathway pseudopilin PulG
VPEEGMSLVEVLVGVTVLSFVALGVMAFLTTTVRQNQMSLERSTATALAAERIQHITSHRFQPSSSYTAYKLSEETAAAGPPPTFTTPVGSIPGYPRYSRTVTLTYGAPVDGLLTVRVDVSWQSLYQGVQKTHTMIQYVHPKLEQGT